MPEQGKWIRTEEFKASLSEARKGKHLSQESRAHYDEALERNRQLSDVECPVCGVLKRPRGLNQHLKWHEAEHQCLYSQCLDLSKYRSRYCEYHGALYNRGRKYGISLEDVVTLFEKSSLKCEICDRQLVARSSRSLVAQVAYIDHDSATGKVRGILCHQCNAGIGLMKHSLSNLQKAIVYLENHT